MSDVHDHTVTAQHSPHAWLEVEYKRVKWFSIQFQLVRTCLFLKVWRSSILLNSSWQLVHCGSVVVMFIYHIICLLHTCAWYVISNILILMHPYVHNVTNFGLVWNFHSIRKHSAHIVCQKQLLINFGKPQQDMYASKLSTYWKSVFM